MKASAWRSADELIKGRHLPLNKAKKFQLSMHRLSSLENEGEQFMFNKLKKIKVKGGTKRWQL